jgi:UDPglucose 6-dehydrogenase
VRLAVVGTGYVGLVTGACFAEFGVTVSCVDNDKSKIASLNEGRMPIFEPGLAELVERNRRVGRLSFTTDLGRAVEQSLVVFIAVGTPSNASGGADLSSVEQVAREIGRHLNGYKVVVTKSTVPMGTGARVRQWIEEESGGKHPLSVASNPEFLREGSAIEDFMRPNRVVIGAEDDKAVEILKDLYRPLYLIETPFVITSVVSAEMIKYASNAFLATKVSFINELADLCERIGADVHEVARGMGLDNRIGRKFLHPGPGYGGSCFPKDTRAIVEKARELGVDLRIVRSCAEVNEDRPERMLDKVRGAIGKLRERTVGILGLSFKPNTDDLRESPAMRIAAGLLREGARVRAFDPVALERARAELPELVACADEYEAASGADALVIATEWNQFRSLDLGRLASLLRQPNLIDLRNIYPPEDARAAGLRYVGVGR